MKYRDKENEIVVKADLLDTDIFLLYFCSKKAIKNIAYGHFYNLNPILGQNYFKNINFSVFHKNKIYPSISLWTLYGKNTFAKFHTFI